MICKHCDNRKMERIHQSRRILMKCFNILISVFQCRNCGAIEADAEHIRAELKPHIIFRPGEKPPKRSLGESQGKSSADIDVCAYPQAVGDVHRG